MIEWDNINVIERDIKKYIYMKFVEILLHMV